MKNNKEKILMIVGIMTLLLFVVGATYAYFVAQGGNAEQTNINVTTHTTDSLVFEVGESISITADQTTFAPGEGNRADSTFARATLKANSSTNSATANYYVYLAIDTNDFKYTTDTKTAELILTVNYKDNDGNITPVTSINGLNYVTVGEVSGFDITEEQNLITIANNYEIISTGTEVDEWDITLTLVNLESNQNDNTGKTFNATLLIQKNAVASQYIASLYTTQGANHLYHHDGTLENGIDDDSYRYSGASYTLTSKASEYNAIFTNLNNDSKSLIKYVADFDSFYNFNDCVSEEDCMMDICGVDNAVDCGYDSFEQMVIDFGNYKFKIDYIEGRVFQTTTEALKQLKEDNYVENNVNNWVCFGSDDETCDNDHLYRIIGVFGDLVKLIKETPGTEQTLGTKANEGNNKYLIDTSSNDWATSQLNINILNGSYLATLGKTWSDKIIDTEWKTGGNTDTNITQQTASITYQNEIVNSSVNSTTNSKIGLMYVSDYGIAASPESWSTNLKSYDISRNNNWLNIAEEQWTISPQAGNNQGMFYIYKSGKVCWGAPVYSYSIRPTFYLKPTVTFAGGTGTETDPYRIA